ncbi:MAG: hypothetical protein DWH73_01890 [Planctomycetota bacterium]|nr:MAG: hypothetical protein DWH73_01890 [Planctomycetota bacterium]
MGTVVSVEPLKTDRPAIASPWLSQNRTGQDHKMVSTNCRVARKIPWQLSTQTTTSMKQTFSISAD